MCMDIMSINFKLCFKPDWRFPQILWDSRGIHNPPVHAMVKRPGAELRMGNGGAAGTRPQLLFSFRQGKCVLESATQFGNTAVSCSSHLA
jgi:hypothetical protein